MNYIKLLVIIAFTCSLPLLGSQPIASASASSCSSGAAAIDSKNKNEKPWMVKTGEGPASIAFSPNGQLAAVVNEGNNTVSVFNVNAQTGAFTQVQGSPFPTGEYPSSVAFSPNGQLAAVANYLGNTVSIFNVNALTGAFTQVQGSPFPMHRGPYSIAFSPNGQLTAVANDDTVSVFNVNAKTGTFTQVQGSPFPMNKPHSVVFSPNGQLTAVTNNDGDTVSVFTVNALTGAFTQVSGSPFPTGKRPVSVVFSPNGQLAAVANHVGNTMSVFNVNALTGAFTQVPGSPFATGDSPESVAFSPNGQLAVANRVGNTMSVFNVNAQTGTFTQVQGSPFPTGKGPNSVAFSPNGQLAAVANLNDDTLWIYEVDEQIGAFTPITGEILQKTRRKEELKKLKEKFSELGKEKHETEKGQVAGLGDTTPSPIDLLMAEYIVGPNAAQTAAAPKENAQEIALQQALAKTKNDREQRTTNVSTLFAAIKAGDLEEVKKNLTPFTINSINEERRTPLMEAVYYGTQQNNQNKDLIKLLLAYQGIMQETPMHKETIRANTKLHDADGNTALMLAIRHKNFEAALLIAQRMSPEEFNIENKEHQTAVKLLLKNIEKYADDKNYNALLKLINHK